MSGAPGAFARDFGDERDSVRFGEIRLLAGQARGDFRRPLDAGDHEVTRVSGHGWSSVGPRSTAIGRFVLERDATDVSTYTARVAPYVSSPIVMTDSVQPPMQTTRVRLEGALGFDVAGFGLGVAGALDSREHNSVDFPLRRSGRAAFPAIAAGVERAMPWLGLRIGAFYRWSEPNESNRLNPSPLSTLVYSVRGFDEPFGLPVTALTPIFVRNDSRASATGVTFDATIYGTRLVVTHEGGRRRDEQTTAPFNRVRPLEVWRANGTTTNAQAQRVVRGALATLVVTRQRLNGDGTRSDLEGVAFRGTDARRALELDIRYRVASKWLTALSGGVVETKHQRNDFAAGLSADVGARQLFVSGEAAREFGIGAIALGASASAQVPLTSDLPDPSSRGVVYNRLIAPGLAYEVADARAAAFWVTATRRVRSTRFLLSVRSESAVPRSVATDLLQPGGNRRAWSAHVGVRW